MPRCCTRPDCWRRQTSTAIRSGLRADRRSARARRVDRSTLDREDGQTALETLLTRRIGAAGARAAPRPLAQRPGADGAAAVPARRRRGSSPKAPTAWPTRSTAWRASRARSPCPATRTCSRRCRARWRSGRGGFAAELRDDARACGTRTAASRRTRSAPPRATARRTCRSIARPPRTRSASPRMQEPVTAVQLSRGKAEAEAAVRGGAADAGPRPPRRGPAAVLHAGVRRSSTLPDAFTTGSSIMPQKRNPDVFELVRGRTATAQACLVEALGISAKLPSGYQRDLQLIKAPLFRCIDLCARVARHHGGRDSADALPARERIRIDADIHAAARGQRAGRRARASRSARPTGASARSRAARSNVRAADALASSRSATAAGEKIDARGNRRCAFRMGSGRPSRAMDGEREPPGTGSRRVCRDPTGAQYWRLRASPDGARGGET